MDRSIKIFDLEVDTNINMCTDRLKTKDLSEKCKSRGSGACRRYHSEEAGAKRNEQRGGINQSLEGIY